MSSIACTHHPLYNLHAPPGRTPFSTRTHFPLHLPPHLVSTICTGLKSYNWRFAHNFSVPKANISAWDEKPYEILPGRKISYLDEQDVVTFLDPPKELIPLDPASYNPATYLWKKIEDIPGERRYRLLRLLQPRLVSRAWEIASARYDDPKFAKKIASTESSNENGQMLLEFYNCRASGGPWPISGNNFFKKAIFSIDDGNTYGRFIIKSLELEQEFRFNPFSLTAEWRGGSILAKFANTFSPLYFAVRQLSEVMSTEQPCDLAYEFGDGLFGLHKCPEGFPKPAKHPYPFDDQVVMYIRHVGPGVLVGQAWQEGKELLQVPHKLCGEILMVKDYSPPSYTH